MAVLTAQLLADLRLRIERDTPFVGATKAQMNAALQATEDWFEANRAALNTAINTATSPVTLTVAVKRLLLIYFLLQKATRE